MQEQMSFLTVFCRGVSASLLFFVIKSRTETHVYTEAKYVGFGILFLCSLENDIQ